MTDPLRVLAWITLVIVCIAFWILVGSAAYTLIVHLSR